MGWNPQAVVLFRTSREVLHVPALLPHPTAPHLAAFYLALTRSAVCAPPSLREPAPKCDQTKKRPSNHVSSLRACSLQSICRVFGDCTRVTVSPSRSRQRRRSCGGRARCLQIGRRRATSRRLLVRRG